MTTNLMEASRQWASRPNDERYLDLESLRFAVAARKAESWTAVPPTKDLRATVDENNSLAVQVYDPTQAENRLLYPSHWGFGQLSQYASAPAAYLRTLPSALTAINLQYGFEHNALRESGLILAQSNGDNVLRAITSQSYGRIWDIEVVDAVMKVNQNGEWKVPAASYATQYPKRATTLYAGDRDVFIFLVDPDHAIEVNGETLFRGFITWNSEVGSAVFGLTTFLYRYVCDNRIVWGATDVKELRIRHTGGAPERFAYEGRKYLTQYANESTAGIVQTVKKAQAYELPKAAEKGAVAAWLRDRGFTDAVAKASVAQAEAEEGEARSLWDIVNGITAYARTVPHTDARVKLEAQAGKLMQLAA